MVDKELGKLEVPTWNMIKMGRLFQGEWRQQSLEFNYWILFYYHYYGLTDENCFYLTQKIFVTVKLPSMEALIVDSSVLFISAFTSISRTVLSFSGTSIYLKSLNKPNTVLGLLALPIQPTKRLYNIITYQNQRIRQSSTYTNSDGKRFDQSFEFYCITDPFLAFLAV